MQGDRITNVLEDLVETLEDGRQGFELASDRLAKDGHDQLAARMAALSDQRSNLSVQLREIAIGHGIEIDGGGSAGGSLRRGWMTLTDALTGDDPHAVLTAAERGEDHAVKEYEKALQSEELGELEPVIAMQAEVVQATHDEVRALRDQHK